MIAAIPLLLVLLEAKMVKSILAATKVQLSNLFSIFLHFTRNLFSL